MWTFWILVVIYSHFKVLYFTIEHGLGVQVAPKTFSEEGIIDLWIGEGVIIHYINNEHTEGVTPMIRDRLVQLAKV